VVGVLCTTILSLLLYLPGEGWSQRQTSRRSMYYLRAPSLCRVSSCRTQGIKIHVDGGSVLVPLSVSNPVLRERPQRTRDLLRLESQPNTEQLVPFSRRYQFRWRLRVCHLHLSAVLLADLSNVCRHEEVTYKALIVAHTLQCSRNLPAYTCDRADIMKR